MAQPYPSPAPVSTEAVPSRVSTFRHADVETLDRIEAREIGFDFARRGLSLPDHCGTALREGWLEGRAKFGHRTDGGTPWDRKLLRLRLSAWRRSRIVDASVTPELLEKITYAVCPITRETLTVGADAPTDATVDRVYNDGAYAAGNLAVMSRRANHAKANRDLAEIAEIADGLGDAGTCEGLGVLEWQRLASLCCLAEPRANDHRFLRPMLVWPPNGLLLSNVGTQFMAVTSRLAAGHFRPEATVAARKTCRDKHARKAFDTYMETLQISLTVAARRSEPWHDAMHQIEDAWRSPLLMQRFIKFFLAIAKHPQDAVALHHAIGHGGPRKWLKDLPEGMMQGWSIESRGYVTSRRDEL